MDGGTRRAAFEIKQLLLIIFISAGINVLLLCTAGRYIIGDTVISDAPPQRTTRGERHWQPRTDGLPRFERSSERHQQPTADGLAAPRRGKRHHQPIADGVPDESERNRRPLKRRDERNRQPTADRFSEATRTNEHNRQPETERNRQPVTDGLLDLKTRAERDLAAGLTNKLPGIILAGVQKGGTSSLSLWLRKNRMCFSSIGKEVHYFDSNRNRGIGYYQSLFRDCPNKLLAVDASPRYMINRGSVSKSIRSAYEQANELSTLKIICILREPVSRELSWYNHQIDSILRKKKRPEKKLTLRTTFDEYVESDVMTRIEGTKARSIYVSILRKWFDLFDREQILILSKAEMDTDPETMKRRIQLFLGVNFNDKYKGKGFPRKNSKDNPKKLAMPSCVSQSKLASRFEPYNEALYRFLDGHPGPFMEQRPFPKFRLGNCTDSISR